MKKILFIGILFFPFLIFCQTVKDSLKLDNTENRIIAIIDSSLYFTPDPKNESDEIVSDFIDFTNKLKIKIGYPIDIIVCNNIYFRNKKFHPFNNSIYYLVIKKGTKKPYFIDGYDDLEKFLKKLKM
jgi:hypothetical protein